MTEQPLHWNLDEILGGQSFEGLYRSVEKGLTAYRRFLKEISPNMDGEKFAQFLLLEQKMTAKLKRLDVWTELQSLSSPTSPEMQHKKAMVNILMKKDQEVSRPIQHWIMGKRVRGKRTTLDGHNFNRLKGAVPGLEYHLRNIREGRSITVDEDIERILERTAALESLVEVYLKITSKFLYQYRNPESGEITPHNYDSLQKQLTSP